MQFNGVGNISKDKIQGVGNFAGGVYGDLKIDGVCTIESDIEAETLNIDGVCTCMGNVTAKVFDCDGVLTINGNLKVGAADIDGVVTVNGNKIEADRIKCDGTVSVAGEISADVIDANGIITAESIVGDEITIRSYWKKWYPKFMFLGGKKSGNFSGLGLEGRIGAKFSAINLIEGTTVELRGVKAKSVNGQNVSIGKNCNVERVDASGELSIHPSAVVGEVVHV